MLFIYLGCITNAITFGGLLGDATDNYQVHLAVFYLTLNMTACLKLHVVIFYGAFNKQVCDLASSIALFFFVPLFLTLFPCLSPCQGVMESFLGTALAGTVFCMFSGQPLIILSSTGPILIFEKLLYEFSK